MNQYVNAIKNLLNEDSENALKAIYEPTVVGTPLADARRDVCVLPSGEIRAYQRHHSSFEETKITPYLSSTDGGVSWSKKYSHGVVNSCTYIDEAKVYLTVADKYSHNVDGLWCLRSNVGPDDENPEWIKVSDDNFCDTFLPIKSAFTNRVWITTHRFGTCTPAFFYSDDFGLTWNAGKIALNVEFEAVFPHKGLRWCKGSGSEPYAVELSENKMMMILRTPTDRFYQSFSTDGGESWSEAEPSFFYGTDTTPFLLRLNDGRVITFWNNTKPLPEANHKAQFPSSPALVEGRCEDVFTNRDAAHAAISSDGGETWIGYREILLNEIRNCADFRYKGDPKTSNDKSVHQYQAFELPFNKVLVSVGQNFASRRFVIFDVDWLYEQSSKEEFARGLNKVSTHTYVKSLSGHTSHAGGVGHCAFNRTDGALLMPDPDGGRNETLLISKHHDSRLVSDIQGVVWNFPMSKKGTVKVQLKLVEKSIRFVLTDRWYNACDAFAAVQSPFWFEVDTDDIGCDTTELVIQYDVNQKQAIVSSNCEQLFKVNMTVDCPTGISYLLIQCATDGDSDGVYIKSMEKQI